MSETEKQQKLNNMNDKITDSSSQSEMKEPSSPSLKQWLQGSPGSLAQSIKCRAIVVIISIILVQVGKSHLPQQSVQCVEDSILKFFNTISIYLAKNIFISHILMFIIQLLVEGQIIAYTWYWYNNSTTNTVKYPISLFICFVCKAVVSYFYQNQVIEFTTKKQVHFLRESYYFPSLIFSDNLSSSYFFSMSCAWLGIIMADSKSFQSKFSTNLFKIERLWKLQLAVIVFYSALMMTLKMNYNIDIVAGLAVGWYVHKQIGKFDKFFNAKLQQ